MLLYTTESAPVLRGDARRSLGPMNGAIGAGAIRNACFAVPRASARPGENFLYSVKAALRAAAGGLRYRNAAGT